MPQKTNLNVEPFFDDFDPSKNFYKVLFRPGYSIQSRELTTLQSILQNQIESYGKFQFKQGELVIPGEVGFNNNLNYVKLSSVSEVAINDGGEIVFRKYDIKTLVGQKVRGITSGVVASIVAAEYSSETESDVIFVKYVNSGDAAVEPTFRQGETLEVIDGVNTPLLVVGTDGSVLPTSINVTNPDTGQVSTLSSPAMGIASAVKVEQGIYFVNGFFVRNDEQLIVIDKYYNKPSTKVGFTISESLVTSEEDNSLYDNAKGYSNFSAPGASRLKITLTLTKFGYTAVTDRNFIQLLKIKSGIVEKKVRQFDYNLLEETLARRTFDESGDYVVEDFPIDIREYYQRNGNNGFYSLNRQTNTVNGLSIQDASKKLVASIGPGKAYVRGFEIINKETKYVLFDKARDVLERDNVTVKGKGLSEFKITNVYGTVPLNAEGAELTAYPNIYFYSVFNDGSVGSNGTELSDAYKQTISRRGSEYTYTSEDVKFNNEDIAIKTIYLESRNPLIPFASISDSNFQTDFGTLYFRKTADLPFEIDSVKTLAWSIVDRPEIGTGKYLELTVYGRKDQLYTFFKEYQEGAENNEMLLYLSRNDALTSGSAEWAALKDYNEIITPLIGVAKPKNLYFNEYPTGFNTDTDKVISKGRLSAGRNAYNGIFSLSYFNPIYFTKITLDGDIASGTFGAGKYIIGAKSGAYGVVEGLTNGFYSTGNTLYVKVLSGAFEPGEPIADEDDNVRRIAIENTISHFIVHRRNDGGYVANTTKISLDGIEYDSSIIKPTINGSGIIYRVDIQNRNLLLQTYSAPPEVRAVVFGGADEVNPEVGITAVLFKNTVTNYTAENVKSFYSTFGPANVNRFSADVELINEKYSSTSDIGSYSFSGVKGYRYLESNGFGDDAGKYVKQGDLIQFTDSAGVVNRLIVQSTSSPSGSVKTRILLDSALQADVNNSTIARIRPKQSNTAKPTLIFPTGSKQVQSLVKDSSDSKFTYYFRRDFVVQATSSGGNLTFAAQLPFGTQRFVRYTKENYIFTVLDKGNSTVVEKGDILYIDDSFVTIDFATDATSGLSSGSLRLNLPDDFFGDNVVAPYPTLKLTATLEVKKAKPRLKTSITNKRIVISAAGDRNIPLRGFDYDTEDTQNYSYSDVYNLRYVYLGGQNPPVVDTDGNLVSGEDITHYFTFDDGQRDTFLDVSRLVLKSGFDAPNGQIVVGFDYFEHSQGDFVTVNSYLHEAGVGEDEVPLFNSAVYGTISLKDVIDFRPKVDSTSVISGFQDRSLLASGEFTAFTGPGGVSSSTPAVDTNLEFTISFSESQYLDRIDGVFLTKKGDFILKEGNSSLNPAKPEAIDDSIALCYVYVPSFTTRSEDVKVIPVDNRRYTMRDIGKIEKRVERLEYYTTLSILEQQALNMQVKDDIGFDRFKTGFIVDNFETHKVGNLKSIDYKCSIDSQQSVLRPQVKEDSFSLKEVNESNDQRILNGYVYNDGIVTLPYSNLNLVQNTFATKTINPNPFVVLQYAGDVELDPSIDQWFDDATKPLLVNDNTGLFTIFSAKQNVYESFSSIYNNFVINWVGSDRTFYNTTPLTNITSVLSSSNVEEASVSSTSNISPQNFELAQGTSKKVVGKKSVLNALQLFARTKAVKFTVKRMKPETELFAFLDGRNIGRWINPDIRYTGIAGNSTSSFGGPIITDSNGNASGIIVIPSGFPPVEGTSWTGDVETVEYDNTVEGIKFSTGEKTIRFTSSSTDENKEVVETYGEAKYFALGALPENPQSVISTRPSIFKANEGVQSTESNTDLEIKPNPLAQTFKVENYEGGVFATGIDLFFNKKSPSIPIRVYLTNVDIGKPSKNIIPGSISVLNPETKLKVFASGNLSIKRGENIIGLQSGASGPIDKVFDKNNVEILPLTDGSIVLNNEQVYTLVLSNHTGIEFLKSETLTSNSLTAFNSANATSLSLTIAKDSGKIKDLVINSTGVNYDSAILTIESPQLPGGSTATAVCRVSGGKIYDAELTIPGTGYTENPSVVIRGTGTGASGAEIKAIIEIDTPAVQMGVAIDPDGVVQSTTPTRFNFKHPVYLQNNANYSLVIETDSTDYSIWTSELGKSDISTNVTVTSQPGLGSVYKSQNTDTWTEDLFEDIKFNLYRAEFDISRTAELFLTNENMGYEKIDVNPFETSARSNSTATSPLFKNNNAIVKVYHRDHGFEDTGKSFVFFKDAQDVGGITGSTLNTTLFEVSNSGVDTYNITAPFRAGNNQNGGGSVLASYNRKYERLYAQVNYLQTEGTKINSFVKTTNVVPVDSNTQNYVSYSVSDFEKTFLNEDQYFNNQKFIASRINQTLNNLDNSLTYRLELSSNVSYLSPVIDVKYSSVKLSSNRVEHPLGQEDRYGKRYQKIKFFPVYYFSVTGTPLVTNDVDLGQTVQGKTSLARGEVIKYNQNVVWVRLTTLNTFEPNEELFFSSQSDTGGDFFNETITIAPTTELNPGVIKVPQNFNIGETIFGMSPDDNTVTYVSKISGKVIYWDSESEELFVENNKRPINDDYSAKITVGSPYARKANITDQESDIFRVNDLIYKSNQPTDDLKFIKIISMEFDNGVDFVSELNSKNGSSLAKYVTKEIAMSSDGTAIDVRLTANIRDVSNIRVYYKTKESSAETNFEDIDWTPFNGNGSPDIDILETATNTISGNFEDQKSYQELTYSDSGLPNFSSFAIKVVMQTTDPAYVPKIQDMRAVASF